jgi:2-C-methyl-D-erythritol 4-phosphate cytidylyltransferase
MHTNDQIIDAIIVAAGSGTRLGASVPKAYIPLCGKPLFCYSLETFLSHPQIGSVIVVVPESMIAYTVTITADYSQKPIHIVSGGKERWESVWNGIQKSSAHWVLIHDAARPFLTHPVIDSVLQKRVTYQCAITVVPEVDTIRTFDRDVAVETLDRSKVVRVGTPQLFNAGILKSIMSESAANNDHTITDEAMLMEKHGYEIAIAWGDSKNFKITTPVDYEIAEALLEKQNRSPLHRL